MANKFQVKRTSTSGVTPNTTSSSNTAYIAPGELAINMADSKLFTANTTGGLLELGSNLTSLTVTSLYANGSVGSSGKILTSNGTGIYWGNSSSESTSLLAELNTFTFTITSNTTVIEGSSDEATILSYNSGLESVFINGSRQISGVDYNTTNASAITLTSNVISGDVVQVTTFNASLAEQAVYTYTVSSNTTVFEGADDNAETLTYISGLESVFINGSRQISGVDYNTTNTAAFTLTSNAIAGDIVQLITWTDISNSTNTNLTYTWSNAHVFSNTVTFNGGITANSSLTANGSTGTSGQILASNGTSVYWTDANPGDITGVTAGDGISGGGTSGTVTVNVLANTGITANSTGVFTNDSAIVHDNLSGFVSNEHIDHSSVSVTAGNGLSGGGDLTTTRTLSVLANTGIIANSSGVFVDFDLGSF